jgi:ribosomal protein S18 acetylase RimI-like enzyme
VGSYEIRPVKASDLEQISEAHTAIWKATYMGMVAQDRLDALTPAQSATRWRETVGDFGSQAARRVHLRCATSLVTQEMVGFAMSGPARDRNPPAATELWSLNVVPHHHGTGVALDLMTSVLGGTGISTYLWVARDNSRAVAFYLKHGFELDGATRYDPEWSCHEVRMTVGQA